MRGDLDDLDALAKGAAESDAVVHLAFVHDYGNFEDSVRKDGAAIEALGSALEGTGGPVAIASGTLGAAPGRIATEQDLPTEAGNPRSANAKYTLDLADKGVRPVDRAPVTVRARRDRPARFRPAITRELVGWEPTHPGLISDLERGFYFE